MKKHDPLILDRLLDPLGRLFTPEVALRLARYRVDRSTQARLERLARKCNEGKLTEAERREYEEYIFAIDFIGILQAKARALLKRPAEASQ